jgi:hypothetical protein
MTHDPQSKITAAAIGHVVARMTADVRAARPVVTTCPCCGRPNPCPLHLYAEQVAHCRERNL